MRILITGGAGFIGKQLLDQLCSENKINEIIVLDNYSPLVHGVFPIAKGQHRKARILRDDIRYTDFSTLNDIKYLDAIVHLAADTATARSMYLFEESLSTNVMGTARLLSYIQRSDIDLNHLVLTSTRAVYGDGKYRCDECANEFWGDALSNHASSNQTQNWDFFCDRCKLPLVPMPMSVLVPTYPKSIYGSGKLQQENIVRTFCSAREINFSILRLQNVYGPGQSKINPYTGVLQVFIQALMSGRPIDLYEDGKMLRDFIHIADVADLLLRLVLNETGVGIIDIGTGIPSSISEIAKTLHLLLESESIIRVNGLHRFGDVRHAFSDTTNIKKIFPTFNPKPLSDGLAGLIEAFDDISTDDNYFDVERKHLTQHGLLKSLDGNPKILTTNL